MKKYLLLVLASSGLNFGTHAQNIVKAEYFVDNDPGVGAATDVPITAATAITDKLFNIPITSLADGAHQLYFRVKDANGIWSTTERTIFYKLTPSVVPPATNITKAEYYIDNDPGIGVATNIPITAGLSITDFSVTINVASLVDGMHQLYVRFKDTNGIWSTTERSIFYKLTPSIVAPAVNITKAEYYIDNDPGIGVATNIPITAGLSITDFPVAINVASLVDGMHQLYVRFKDTNGVWSTTERSIFYKLSPSIVAPAVNITKAEYYIDNDPGIGVATNIPITAGLSISNLLLSLNVSALAEGSHKLFVRFKDANGIWSITESTNFSVCNGTVPTASPAIAITTSGFTANWATITGALSYQLDVSADNFATFVSGYNSKIITAPTITATVTGLSQATQYQYRVRAVVTCASVPSPTVTVNVPVATPPAQPSSMVFTSVGTNNATVSYTAPASLPTGYLVVRKAGAYTTFVPSTDVVYTSGQSAGDGVIAYAGPNALFNETALTANTNYFYTVYAYNQLNGFTSYLTPSPLKGNFFTMATKPTAQPTNLQFTSVTSTSYTVGFTAAVGSPAGYLVLRKIGSAPTSIPVDGIAYSSTVGADAIAYQGNASTFAESGLTQNTNYYYTIFSYNGANTSISYLTSTPLQGNKLTPLTPPSSAATNMQFSSVTPNSLTVTYTPPIPTPSGYLVVRKIGSGSTFAPLSNTAYTAGQVLADGVVAYAGPATSFSDSGLLPSTIYYYDVFAYNQAGALISYQTPAPFENSKSTFTAEPTAQPASLLFNSITSTSLKLTFMAASPAPSGYLVLRKVNSAPTSTPIDGNGYTAGNSIGDGTVVFVGNSLSIDELGLTPGTNYFYEIFSYNGSGSATNYLTTLNSSNSGSTITVPGKPLASPASVVQQNQFTANWASTPGANTYKVDVSKDNFINKVPGFDDLSVSSTSITVTGLDAGTNYQYRVRAVNASGTSVNSDAIGQITVPPTPTFTTTTNVGQTGFTANWTATTGASGYYIDVSGSNDFSNPVSGYQNSLLGNVTSVDISGLTPGLTYYYRLRSSNVGGTSPNSSAGIQLLIPATPVAQDASNLTSVAFKAKWQSAAGATEYKVDVSLSSSDFNPSLSNYTDISVTGGVLELLVNGLQPNTPYKYRVRATNSSGTSPSSTPISVSTLTQGNSGLTSQEIPGLSSGGTLESYRMFSIPWSLQNNNYNIEVLFSREGIQSNDKWRLLRWNSVGKTWDEYPRELSTIDRGKSYWFNSVTQAPVFVTGTPYSDSAFPLILQPGWNQIASPYDKNISWEDVLTQNNSVAGIDLVETNLYKYVTSPTIQFAVTDNLKAWSGNFVFNKGNQITLTIPVTTKEATGGRLASHELGKDISSNQWEVPLRLIVEGSESSYTAIGMHPDASIGIDRFDGMTVPRFGNYVELNSNHPEFFEPHFSKDIVTTQENFNWHFIAESNIKNRNAMLNWSKEALGNNDAQLLLFDTQNGKIIDMKKVDQYRFTLNEKHSLHFFFSRDKENLRPDITLLSSVYPNPVTTSVTFLFFTSGNENTWIEVYDMVGKKIKTVVNTKYEAGLQQVQWDATDDQGMRIAPGLYVYRFAASNNTLHSEKLLIK